jgi:hypothetical protein
LTTAPQKSLKEAEFLQNRKVLLILTLLNITVYLALLIPLVLYSESNAAVYSV